MRNIAAKFPFKNFMVIQKKMCCKKPNQAQSNCTVALDYKPILKV